MTTNPLEPVKAAKGGRVTVDMLHAMAERSNKYRWVIESGSPYFVNRRWDETKSEYVHFLDRQ